MRLKATKTFLTADAELIKVTPFDSLGLIGVDTPETSFDLTPGSAVRLGLTLLLLGLRKRIQQLLAL